MGNDSSKPVIVITSFGTIIPEGLQDLDNVDRMVRARYPDNEVRWVFGGDIVRDILRKKGQTTLFERKTPIMSQIEVYNDLKKQGKFNIAVQYLFLLPGSKGTDPHMAVGDTEGLNVEFGYPLFMPPDNIARTADILAPHFGDEDTATLICAHGNGEVPTLNVPLLQMDSYVRKHYKNVFLATVVGPPGTERAIADIRKTGLKKVKYFPLLFVAGSRLTQAVMSDDPTSFKSQLGMEGTTESGLGGNPEVVSVWMESIDWTLARF
ncbi:MAG: sirohydrochlorin cobaltochelatase [Dehalococcoidales bacterium]|jgi:sirohydrochlorin cobaltochelatase